MEQKILQSKKKLENRILIRLVKFLDVLFVTAIFGYIWMKFYSELISIPYYKKGNYLIIALFCIMYYLLAHLYQGFMIHLSRISEIIYAQVLSVIISDGLMYLVTMLLMRRIPNILPMLLAIFCQYVVIWGWSKCAHRWYFKTFEYGKYNTTPYDKLLMDLMYIGKPSLAEDIKICFATVKILFMPESTEGVKEGQKTAMGERESCK